MLTDPVTTKWRLQDAEGGGGWYIDMDGSWVMLNKQ
jgi:hypothetical protein